MNPITNSYTHPFNVTAMLPLSLLELERAETVPPNCHANARATNDSSSDESLSPFNSPSLSLSLPHRAVTVRQKVKLRRVSRACCNCKLAKTRCNRGRPCDRCVRMEKADSCVDCTQKKRGRKKRAIDTHTDTSAVPSSLPVSLLEAITAATSAAVVSAMDSVGSQSASQSQSMAMLHQSLLRANLQSVNQMLNSVSPPPSQFHFQSLSQPLSAPVSVPSSTRSSVSVSSSEVSPMMHYRAGHSSQPAPQLEELRRYQSKLDYQHQQHQQPSQTVRKKDEPQSQSQSTVEQMQAEFLRLPPGLLASLLNTQSFNPFTPSTEAARSSQSLGANQYYDSNDNHSMHSSLSTPATMSQGQTPVYSQGHSRSASLHLSMPETVPAHEEFLPWPPTSHVPSYSQPLSSPMLARFRASESQFHSHSLAGHAQSQLLSQSFSESSPLGLPPYFSRSHDY